MALLGTLSQCVRHLPRLLPAWRSLRKHVSLLCTLAIWPSASKVACVVTLWAAPSGVQCPSLGPLGLQTLPSRLALPPILPLGRLLSAFQSRSFSLGDFSLALSADLAWVPCPVCATRACRLLSTLHTRQDSFPSPPLVSSQCPTQCIQEESNKRTQLCPLSRASPPGMRVTPPLSTPARVCPLHRPVPLPTSPGSPSWLHLPPSSPELPSPPPSKAPSFSPSFLQD